MRRPSVSAALPAAAGRDAERRADATPPPPSPAPPPRRPARRPPHTTIIPSPHARPGTLAAHAPLPTNPLAPGPSDDGGAAGMDCDVDSITAGLARVVLARGQRYSVDGGIRRLQLEERWSWAPAQTYDSTR